MEIRIITTGSGYFHREWSTLGSFWSHGVTPWFSFITWSEASFPVGTGSGNAVYFLGISFTSSEYESWILSMDWSGGWSWFV